MSQSIHPFRRKYTHEDGSLIWRDTADDNYQSRDGADDFYESFYNWPLLYLLGGDDHLLDMAHQHWEAVTRQLARLGLVYREYERGYDQFHQGESCLYFYFLCLADPENPRLQARARRFAGFYTGEDDEAPNYDAVHRVIRAPHNGSAGPRWGYADGEPVYGWHADMAPYGLPYQDVPGISSYDDLKNPELARRMGEVMQERMGKGDVATNLLVTSLVANAFLMTGEDSYRRWVADYTGVWQARAQANRGILPDNVGLSGQVGEYINGKWYGGLYGWSWPHGYYNVGMAAVVAGANAALVTGDPSFLDLPRQQIDAIHRLASTRSLSSLAEEFGGFWRVMAQEHPPGTALLVVPYRHQDSGWFDYQSPALVYPLHVWLMTFRDDDRQRVYSLRAGSLEDWRQVRAFRNKEDNGHEQPWLCFLDGENPSYPEAILQEAYAKVSRRLRLIENDNHDLRTVSIHHWQELNPVTTEALLQLMLGAPQVIYNGGLLNAQVRYFDAVRRRPGLPQETAALVERIEPSSITLHLVNLSLFDTQDVVIQAGAFGEHRFTTAHYQERTSTYPGQQGPGGYSAPPMQTRPAQQEIGDALLRVLLPPACELRLTLGIERWVHTPSYRLPWGRVP
jgi:hypothetical protein